MAEAHVSSYDNLKEIFTGHKQKLLNFFAKRSIYGDDKVTMQKGYPQYPVNMGKNFVYNWYRNNYVKTVDTSKLYGSTFIGHGNSTSNFSENSGYNTVLGTNNTLEYWVQRSGILGMNNKLDYSFNSYIIGHDNIMTFSENAYSGSMADNLYVNIFGYNNQYWTNVRGSLNQIFIFGYNNNWQVERTSLVEHPYTPGFTTNIASPKLDNCVGIGTYNYINLRTDDAIVRTTNDFTLHGVSLFGCTNTYNSTNPSKNCASKEGYSTINGYGNYVNNVKTVEVHGHSNTIGIYSASSENEIYYNIYAFGGYNNASYGYSGTLPMHDLCLFGKSNTSTSGTYNSGAFGLNNSMEAAYNSCLLGISNSLYTNGVDATQSNIFVGKSNSGYYSHDNSIFGQNNSIRDCGYSTALGRYLNIDYNTQVIIGNYNENNSNNYFEFGNGTDDEHRHNVAVITRSGDLYLNDGDVINDNGESLTTLRTDIDLLDGRVETLEGKVEDLEDAVDNIEDDVEALGTRVGNNETDIETLQGQVRDLTLALADALSRITELENIVMNEKTNHVRLYTEDGDTRITEDGDNKFTEEVFTNG